MKKLNKDFFNKPRANVMDNKNNNNSKDKIIPFKWAKDVLDGKFKNQVIMDLPKK